MMTDNVNKVTMFNDKVGINQNIDNVEGLLDINNLTYQDIINIIRINYNNVFIASHVINYIKDIPTSQLPVINSLSYTLYGIINKFYKNMFNNELFDVTNQCMTFEFQLYNTKIDDDDNDDDDNDISSYIHLNNNVFTIGKLSITHNIPSIDFNNSESFTIYTIIHQILFLNLIR